MLTEDQVKIAETFLGTAINSGVLSEGIVEEMVNKIRSQDEVLLTYKEVESMLKMSRSSIDRMVAKKQLKRGKVNGSVRFAKSSVDKVIEDFIFNAD